MKRTKPLPARAKPIARGAPPKRRTAVRRETRPRFPKLVDQAYRKWIRGFPCLIADAPKHVCEGVTEAAHVRSRGAGGADRENLVPLCTKAHRHSHLIGQQSFERFYRLSLAELAVKFDQLYAGEDA